MLPPVVAQRRDPFHTAILYDDHLIGVLTEHPEHTCVHVTFHSPTGRRFRLPDCDTVSSGTASLIVAALSYHYRPHEITVHDTGEGFALSCPTCHGAGVPAGLGYATKQAAIEQVVDDHSHRTGHPAVLVDRPHALPPDLAPDNALPTGDERTR